MINLMIKNIFENSNKIDAVVKYVDSVNKRNCLKFLLISLSMTAVLITVDKQEKEIEDLKKEIEEMKSKGE